MKITATLLAFFALAPAPAEKIAFGPKEGVKLEKTFEMSMKLEKRSMSMSIGGQDLPAEAMEGATMDFSTVRKVVVEDEYTKIDDERPLLLARRYTELSDVEEQKVQMMGMPEPQEEKKTKESELADKTVLFRWNEKDSRYDKEWKGDGADDGLLDGLEEDMDMRDLLPPEAVAEGDSWQIDLETFSEILGPGGKLAFEGDDDDDDDDTEFQDNLTGEVICTYKGLKEVDGRKLARIQAVCKGKTSQDQEAKEDEPAVHMDFDIAIEGEFLWDVAGKHMGSYELSGEVTADMKVVQELDMGGETGELVVKVSLGGKIELEGEFKVR